MVLQNQYFSGRFLVKIWEVSLPQAIKGQNPLLATINHLGGLIVRKSHFRSFY